MRKRRQYTIRSYKMSDFNKKGEVIGKGREINLAENQVCELILALKGRKYIEDGENHIPELIFLDVDNRVSRTRLKERIKDGIYINQKRYVRLIRSSSMGRNGTISFIEEDIYMEIMNLITLGKINTIDKAVISKLESYMGLAFSTTIFIDAVPKNICIVDASVFEKTIEDYVKSYRDGELFSGLHKVNIELFDGQGLHCPEWGKKITKELGLYERPTGFQIRLFPAFKGMSYEIDFKKFYREKGIKYIKDYTGKKWNIEDLDCIWTTSMFKFSKYFKGWDEVKELREKYYTPLEQNLIGISNWSDNRNKKTKMTYQYLQSLKLTGDDLVEMSQYTKDIVERVYKGDIGATLIFLGLLADNEDVEEDIMATKVHYAIAKNPEMIHDPYVQSFLQRQLKRTVDEMKLGKFYVDGQYSYTCQDPILMLEMVAGLEPKGCLNKNEFYSTGVEGLRATFRSPLIHSSEIGKLNFIHNDKTDKWLDRYDNIIVLNGFDITAQKHGGSDHDGDTFFWTADEKIINAVIETFEDGTPNYPVVDIAEGENRAEAVKEAYNIDNIIEYDLRTIENRIGQITNIGTYFANKGYKNPKEYDEELVIARLMQGEEIDFVKHGVRTIKAPDSFKKAKRYKPYFLQKYKYNKDKNIQEDIECAPLNILCRHIESFEKELFKQDKAKVSDTTNMLINKDIINKDKEESRRVLKELRRIYKDFKEDSSTLYLKIRHMSEEKRRKVYSTFYDNYHYQVNQISDNKELLSSIAVYICYIEDKKDDKTKSYHFPWVVAWEGLAITIDRTAPEVIKMPTRDIPPNLDAKMIEYLGDVYYLTEALNDIGAYDFIEHQYEKQIEKELKEQRLDFTYETVLYGFNDRSVDEVVDIIKNEELYLGSREYKGKQYAAIFANDKYIASIKDKTDEFIDPEIGYVDLKTMRGNIDIEIIEIHNRSIKVKMKILSDSKERRAV